MRAIAAIVCFAALCAATCRPAEAIRAQEVVDAVLAQQDQNGIMESFTALFGHESKPVSEQKAYALIKYIVVPTKAKGFIEEVREAKKAAEKFDGYITYNLVKPVDDNISYYAWAAWETVEDLKEYIESDSARKLLEYTAKEDIVVQITGVKPLV